MVVNNAVLCPSLSPLNVACPQVVVAEGGLQMFSVFMSILNKQLQTANKEWSSSLEVGKVLTTRYHKSLTCYK
jgi:hypothetical protein